MTTSVIAAVYAVSVMSVLPVGTGVWQGRRIMETPAIVISGIAVGVGTLLLIAYAGGSRELAQQHETAAALAAHAQANAAESKRIEMASVEAGRKLERESELAWQRRHANDPQTLELRRLEAEDRAAFAANHR